MRALFGWFSARLELSSLFLSASMALSLAPLATHATDEFWINTGTITEAPQVDAFNFVNSGVIRIVTSQPFETSNTRNFTNSGSMIGGEGWFFDNAPELVKLRVLEVSNGWE